MKGCVFLLRKKAVVAIVVAIISMFLLSLPVSAQETVGNDNRDNRMNLDFIKTITSVRFIGHFRHYKEVEFFGGSAEFWLGPREEGQFSFGEVGGTHKIISSAKSDLYGNIERKTHINVNFFGTTDDTHADMMTLEKETLALVEAQRHAAIELLNKGLLDANLGADTKIAILNNMEQQTVNTLEAQRRSAIASLNQRIQASTAVTGGNYYTQLNQLNTYYDMAIAAVKDGHALARESAITGADQETGNILAEMDSLNEYYDQLHRSVIGSFNVLRQQNVNIATYVDLDDGGELFTRISMDPGESGYIKQGVYTYSENMMTPGQEGDYYLKINNRFKNTGGTTVRNLDIPDYIEDNMRVIGYAEVWETTEIKRGDTKTGWWDPNF
jgi:hypothetical protein